MDFEIWDQNWYYCYNMIFFVFDYLKEVISQFRIKVYRNEFYLFIERFLKCCEYFFNLLYMGDIFG